MQSHANPISRFGGSKLTTLLTHRITIRALRGGCRVIGVLVLCRARVRETSGQERFPDGTEKIIFNYNIFPTE